ncbi:MAG: putative lipid II flippase FtsW [Actinobacteria bacterium]|nr:putative lipid II flippase FtsW [Actinomycetota bacterium]
MGSPAAAGREEAGRGAPPRSLVEARKRRDAARSASSHGSPPRSGTAGRAAVGSRVRSAGGLTATGYSILGVVLVMFLFGMVMIFSASSGTALRAHGSSYYYLLRQAVWFGVGLAAMCALAYMDYRRLAALSPLLTAVTLVGLAAVLLIGTQAYGSKRSIVIGPVVVQPSEVAKLALLLLAAHFYCRRAERLDDWREIVNPVLLATALTCGLIIAEPDLGSMLVVALTVFIVLFLAGAPWRRLAVLAAMGGGATVIFIFSSAYRKARFLSFLDPWSVAREGGFHIIQSMIALGSGRLSGLGLGMSRQKFFYLPNAHTDFIFSIIGEETGLIGTLAVLALFVLLTCLGLRVARRAPDRLGRVLAMGITCMLGVQAVINMGAATGIMPITGITLPFFSYGGSSLVICMCLAGILINVSRQEVAERRGRERRSGSAGGDLRRRNGRPSPSPARPGRRARIA